ncbi:MAG: 4Fe-4S binding protein, partial [Chloroflexi bacterium]|nr:4Fe-4S binding protein [Chloroflexota bacterium]
MFRNNHTGSPHLPVTLEVSDRATEVRDASYGTLERAGDRRAACATGDLGRTVPVDEDACIGCMECVTACPEAAIAV